MRQALPKYWNLITMLQEKETTDQDLLWIKMQEPQQNIGKSIQQSKKKRINHQNQVDLLQVCKTG